MAELTKIDVCIATFKRPSMLSALLASLIQQKIDGISMRIVVIDNDRDRSAYPAVQRFCDADSRGLVDEVVYDVEPQQNIAIARNRALSHVKAEYFAFIDDDETVSTTWLRSLLNTLILHRADLAFGPVHSALPPDAPEWAMTCFHKKQRQTGTVLQSGGAGNVLIKRCVIEHPSVRFNPAFGLTGGEDTEFFYRLFLSGRRLVWCEEAWASEPVSDTRLTLQWIRRRGFRSGQTYSRIFVTRYSGYRKILWFGTKILQLAGGVVMAPIIRCLSYPSYVALTVRIAAASGQLSCCFSGENFEEYSARHYQ